MKIFLRLPEIHTAAAMTSVLLLAAGYHAPALAQAQEDAPKGVLEEVIVTAQKREQAMQDVPIALSVVGAEDIEKRSISDFVQLFELMPNTTITQNVTAIPRLAIRGVTTNTNNIGIESGVGVVVDDVFLGRPSAFSSNLIDVERVEVLRGPQGTLFGKNTIGGLVNIVTAKPRNRFGAEGDLTYGEDNLVQARGFVTGPIASDDLAGKLSFTVKQRDGWVNNTNPDAEDLQSVDFWGLRGQLLGTPSDSFSWLLSAEYSEDDSVENYEDVLDGGLAAVDGDPYDRTIGTNGTDWFKREMYGVSLKLDWRWHDLDFVSVTAVRGTDWTGRNDQDYTSVNFFSTGRDEDHEQFSQEFRVLGGDDRFKWIAGLYYFDQDQEGMDVLYLHDMTPVLFAGLPYIPGYEEHSETKSTIATKSMAGFVSGTWNFADRWTLTGGFRYTDEEKDFTYRQDLDIFLWEVAPGYTVPLGIIAALNPTVEPFADSRSDGDWSGDLSLGYEFTADVNGYAKISRGFKAGGFQSSASSVPDPGKLSFDSENLVSYELGLKSDLADRRVRLNLAAFYSDYSDKQEQFFNGVTNVYANAASATIKGMEADITAVPTDWLMLAASVGYQDATYDEFVDPLAETDYSGNQMPATPEWTASFTGQINQKMANGWSWLLRADVSYRDEVYNQQDNDPFFVGESMTLVSARLGFTTPSGRYTFALWSKNLLDEDFVLSKNEVAGVARYHVLNEPRSWGIELRGRWGD